MKVFSSAVIPSVAVQALQARPILRSSVAFNHRAPTTRKVFHTTPASLVQPTEQATDGVVTNSSIKFSKDVITDALTCFPVELISSITRVVLKVNEDAGSLTPAVRMYVDVGTDEDVKALLSSTRTIAVVGASRKESTPVFKVMEFLIEQGYKVIPVNPREAQNGGAILGQAVVEKVSDIKERVDLVDIFLRADRVPAAVDDAMAQGARAVWTQLDVDVEPETIRKAQREGMTFVTNRCPKLEIPSLGISPA